MYFVKWSLQPINRELGIGVPKCAITTIAIPEPQEFRKSRIKQIRLDNITQIIVISLNRTKKKMT